MVEIRIVIEGGVLPNSNVSAATIDNSEKLREAFHKLLFKVIDPEKFNLVVEIGAGYKNAAKSFKEYASIDDTTSLLIDLDGAKTLKEQRLSELDIEEFASRVFFMIQEMEAWILAQPEVIEKCYNDRYIRRRQDREIVVAERDLFQIHPEEIVTPADKLNVILGRYYLEIKGNEKKKKKYGKLKDAPLLLENLDVSKLVETFNDFRLLINHIEEQSKL